MLDFHEVIMLVMFIHSLMSKSGSNWKRLFIDLDTPFIHSFMYSLNKLSSSPPTRHSKK